MTSRTRRRPSGSRPEVGSSRKTSSGSPRSAWASPSRCFIPLLYSRTRRAAASTRSTRRSCSSMRGVQAAATGARGAGRGSAAAPVPRATRGRRSARAGSPPGPGPAGRPSGRPEEPAPARRRVDEAEEHLHGGRLARPVRPQEAEDLAPRARTGVRSRTATFEPKSLRSAGPRGRARPSATRATAPSRGAPSAVAPVPEGVHLVARRTTGAPSASGRAGGAVGPGSAGWTGDQQALAAGHLDLAEAPALDGHRHEQRAPPVDPARRKARASSALIPPSQAERARASARSTPSGSVHLRVAPESTKLSSRRSEPRRPRPACVAHRDGPAALDLDRGAVPRRRGSRISSTPAARASASSFAVSIRTRKRAGPAQPRSRRASVCAAGLAAARRVDPGQRRRQLGARTTSGSSGATRRPRPGRPTRALEVEPALREPLEPLAGPPGPRRSAAPGRGRGTRGPRPAPGAG